MPLDPEPDHLDPRPILAPVVPEPVHREEVLLDLAGDNRRNIYNHVAVAVEFQRERSVGRDLGEAVLLTDVVDDRLGRFVEERDQERNQRRLRLRTVPIPLRRRSNLPKRRD